MRRLVEFPLDDGGSVLLEVEDGPLDGAVTRGMRDNRVLEHAQQSFDQAIGRVQPAAKALVTRFRTMADPPDELVVEFGLQLSAEAGAFIAAASSTANFKVSLTWRRDRSTPGDSARAGATAEGNA
jgi:hypothetical protein